MDTVCCPLFSTATCSSNIFSLFMDPFDILRSHNSSSSSRLCYSPPPPPPSFLLLPHLPPPALTSRWGVPSEDHCLRSEGPLIVGLGALGGVDRINPTNSTIWFPLCLMTMLAFRMQPTRLDQICSIDLDARAARAQADTCVPQYSTQKYTYDTHIDNR